MGWGWPADRRTRHRGGGPRARHQAVGECSFYAEPGKKGGECGDQRPAREVRHRQNKRINEPDSSRGASLSGGIVHLQPFDTPRETVERRVVRVRSYSRATIVAQALAIDI